MSYLKNELSNKNKWKLSKHRYLELVHYCLQYPEWRKELQSIDILRASSIVQGKGDKSWDDVTSTAAIKRAELVSKIELIESVAREAEPDLASYILTSVTKGITYPQIAAKIDIPCGKDMFYDRRRKFFWILDKRRG